MDLLYESLKRSISKWYDDNYIGTKSEKEAKKNMHLYALNTFYKPSDFKKESLDKDRERFLEDIQTIVELWKGHYGY